MKKTFEINGHKVEFTNCTAIAASIGDTKRQNAVFIHDLEDEFRNGDGVIFGVLLPENANEAKYILEENLDFYWETLETIEF